MTDKYYVTVSTSQFKAALGGSNWGEITAKAYDSLDKAKAAVCDIDSRLILEVIPLLETRLETHYEAVESITEREGK